MNSKRSRINDLRRDTRAVAGDPNRHFLHRNQTDPLKSALLAEQWDILLRCHLDLTRQGQSVPRMAEAYALQCDTHLASLDWVSSRHALEDAIQPHPPDTHPRLLQRMQNLRLRMDDFDLADLRRTVHPASHILECCDSLDEALSATRALLSTASVRP